MILKISGSLLIVISSAILGMYYSFKDTFRINDLTEMKKALTVFKSEIEFSRTELWEAFTNVSERVAGPVGGIFICTAGELRKKSGQTAGGIWNDVIERKKNETYFLKEDLDAFFSFGKTLGYLDLNMQINSIDLCVQYIDQRIESLMISSSKTKKMYQSLGVLTGLLIAVILL